ncbi:MAG: AgmX/PglI C-terminal domain-containing protein [Myxococcota bacterium]
MGHARLFFFGAALLFVGCVTVQRAPESSAVAGDESPRLLAVDPEIDKDCVVSADGGMTRDAVQSCIHARLGPVQQCYVKALMADRSLAGKVVLHLTVATSGAMAAVDVSTQGFADPAFDGCVMERVKAWQWPARPEAVGPLKVSYPVFLQTQ